MLKEQAKQFTLLNKLVDVLLIFIAFAVAYEIRSRIGSIGDFYHYLWVLLVIIPVWHLLLSKYGMYASTRTHSIPKLISDLLKVHVIGGIITASLIYFIEPGGFRRILFGIFILLSFLLLTLGKLTLKLILSHIRRRGYNFRNILIVGTNERSKRFIHLVEQHSDWGLKVVGFLGVKTNSLPDTLSGYKVLGTMPQLVDICKSNPVDEVVFCLSRQWEENIDDYLHDLEEMGITVRMVLDHYEMQISRREMSMFHDEIPILTFYSKNFDATQLFLKRCLDFFGSTIGLLITGALYPFIALAIRLDSPGPIFFGQERVGEHGRIFKCWKFRSMYVDAENRKKELEHLNEMSGAIFKIAHDPRITRIGKFLRKTSLDELPQFWNVFCGEMSLVGTRPPTPDEVAKYENWHRRRISIRPGITGLWQVSGRNRINEFDEIVKLDLKYIDQWSIWLDLKIIFKTVGVVFFGTGAQ